MNELLSPQANSSEHEHHPAQSTHNLGATALHTPESPDIDHNYSDPEFPMLSEVTIGTKRYMVTGTYFSVDDNGTYTTDAIELQHQAPSGETITISPTELRSLVSSQFETTTNAAGTTHITMEQNGKPALTIEIAPDYTSEERELLSSTARDALAIVDIFLNGRTGTMLKDLHISVGENLTQGGGEAFADKNTIVLAGKKMLLSLAEMRDITGAYDPNDLTNGSLDDSAPASALAYNIAHEIGHIIDEQTHDGNEKQRINASESPTLYGRSADKWHDSKSHEAFAEGFAHMVYGMPVSEALEHAVRTTIETKHRSTL